MRSGTLRCKLERNNVYKGAEELEELSSDGWPVNGKGGATGGGPGTSPAGGSAMGAILLMEQDGNENLPAGDGHDSKTAD